MADDDDGKVVLERTKGGGGMSGALKRLLLIGAVFAIALVFIIQFRPGSTDVTTGKQPDCAVLNGGTCIVSQGDFVASYRMAAPPNLDNDRLANQLRVMIIEGLVQRWLLLQDAERLGIGVTDKALSQHLANGFARVSLPVDQMDFAYYVGLVQPPEGPARRMFVRDPKTNKFDYARYQKWVARVSTKTLKDFRELQKAEAIAARMRSLIKARARVSESAARSDYARKNSKAVVEFLKLEKSWYKKYVIDQSKKTIDAWAEKNGAEIDESFKSRKETYGSECRRASQILIRIDDTKEDKDAAKKGAREKLEKALARIKKGEKFAEVARDVSEDSATRPKGGDLGCFAAGKLAKPNTTKALDDAAFALKKGKMSDVIETGFGVHVVRLNAVLKGEDAVKYGRTEVARDLYLKKEAERMTAEAAKQILSAVKGGQTLQGALDKHFDAVLPKAAKDAFEAGRAPEKEDDAKKDDAKKGDAKKGAPKKDAPKNAWTDPGRPKIETSNAFSMQGPPFGGIQNPPAAARLLFDIEKVGGVPNDVIKLYDGYAVAQLKEKQSVKDAEWNEKRAGHMGTLRRIKQRDALVAYVHRLRSKLAKTLTYKIKLSTSDDKRKKSPAK